MYMLHFPLMIVFLKIVIQLINEKFYFNSNFLIFFILLLILLEASVSGVEYPINKKIPAKNWSNY